MLSALKLRKDQLQSSLRRTQNQDDRCCCRPSCPSAAVVQTSKYPDIAWLGRSSLLQPGQSRASPAAETAATAGLENRELLQMQQQVMSQQDEDLDQLEKTITGTKVQAMLSYDLQLARGAAACTWHACDSCDLSVSPAKGICYNRKV